MRCAKAERSLAEWSGEELQKGSSLRCGEELTREELAGEERRRAVVRCAEAERSCNT